MNSKIKRITCLVLAMATVLSIALPALAATTTITNQDNPTDFFEYYGSNGQWNDLNTPYHYDASGNVAYCIEHEKDPPSSSGTTYNNFDPSEIFSGSTITGIQAILDHGYPASSGGLGSAQAHYATANAIRAWIRESAGQGYNFMLVSAHTKEHPLQYTVSNVPTRLLIEKQCGVTKTLLTGATFQLKDKDGKLVKLVLQKDRTYQPTKGNENGVESFPVNDKGQVVICYLPAGTYTVVEQTGPVGYAISAPVTTEVGTEKVIATSLGKKQNEEKKNEESSKTDSGDTSKKTEEKDTPTNLLVDDKGNYLAETSLSVVDLPLALKISKVHAKTQKPLMGAAFQLKAADKLTVPLTFRAGSDGVLWYDAKGSVSTIQMDKNAEALIYGLPVGKYQLEETVVPANFFPAVPQNIEITMTNTSEAPKEVVVVNTPTVKLGIDSDKFNVVIAIALTVLIGGGLAAYSIIRRKRK